MGETNKEPISTKEPPQGWGIFLTPGGGQKGVYQLKPIKIYIVEIPSLKGRFEFSKNFKKGGWGSDFFHKMGEVGIIRGLF